MNTDPKNIHDGLRRLTVLVSAIQRDLEKFLEEPQDYVASEYFDDVNEAAMDAVNLAAYVRSEIKTPDARDALDTEDIDELRTMLYYAAMQETDEVVLAHFHAINEKLQAQAQRLNKGEQA